LAPLKFAHPGGIAAAVISQMRREQDVKAIIRQGALLRVKLNLLQHRVPVRIGHNLLFDAVTAITAGVDQLEGRHTIGQPFHFVAGIAFLLGEKLRAVRDDQPHVADAGLVNAGVINLVEDSVAQREPDAALVAEWPCPRRFWRWKSTAREFRVFPPGAERLFQLPSNGLTR
jgi:hypothetical protein